MPRFAAGKSSLSCESFKAVYIAEPLWNLKKGKMKNQNKWNYKVKRQPKNQKEKLKYK